MKMQNVTTIFGISAAAALTLAASVSLFSGAAQAGVTSDLLSCKSNSKQQAINCCEKILDYKKRPYWMPVGSGNCAAVVKCVGSGKLARASYVARPRCYVSIPVQDEQGGGGSPTEPQRPQRPTFSFSSDSLR
jgi:hypothetical protein